MDPREQAGRIRKAIELGVVQGQWARLALRLVDPEGHATRWLAGVRRFERSAEAGAAVARWRRMVDGLLRLLGAELAMARRCSRRRVGGWAGSSSSTSMEMVVDMAAFRRGMGPGRSLGPEG